MKTVKENKQHSDSKPGSATKPSARQFPALETITVKHAGNTKHDGDTQPLESEEGSLTAAESETLKECEEIISKGMTTFSVTGRALYTIQKGKLYRDEYETWEEYLADRWGIARSTSYALIEAVKVMETLSSNGRQKILPENERQVRPLTRLKTSDDRIKAWELACERAKGKAVTGEIVEKVVKEMRGTGESNSGSTWEKAAVKRLRKEGYDVKPDQPISMRKEGIQCHDKIHKCAIKLVVRLKLENVAYILALKEHEPKALVLLNGDRFKSTKVETGEDGAITGLCDDAHAVLFANLGLLVVYKGKLYGEGAVDGDLNLTLKPVTDEAAKALEKALGGKATGNK